MSWSCCCVSEVWLYSFLLLDPLQVENTNLTSRWDIVSGYHLTCDFGFSIIASLNWNHWIIVLHKVWILNKVIWNWVILILFGHPDSPRRCIPGGLQILFAFCAPVSASHTSLSSVFTLFWIFFVLSVRRFESVQQAWLSPLLPVRFPQLRTWMLRIFYWPIY